METITRIRKIYQPLSLAVSVKASGVATAQVYDQYEDTITPERSEDNVTVLTPYVYATTGDNEPSWTDRNVAPMLQEVCWFADGVDICVSGTDIYNAWHEAGSALFEIVSSEDNNNGSLRIWKNFTAEEMYALNMEAKFLDPRTGQVFFVRTDAIYMTCQAKGDAEWDFSVVHDVNIQYCPVIDHLKLYDWKVAKGIITASDAERNKACDATAYDLDMKIILSRGHRLYDNSDGKVTLRAFLCKGDNVEEITTSNCFVLKEFDTSHIRFDQRYMPDENTVVAVRMYVDGEFQSEEQLTFSRYYPVIHARPTNESDIDLAATTRSDKAFVTIDGDRCAYPEAYFRLAWSARTSDTDAWVEQGIGETVSINQAALGIAPDGRDELQVRLEYRIKSGLAPLSNDKNDLIENVNGMIIVTDTLR